MLTKKRRRIYALVTFLAFVATGAFAQQTVYKWVDKDGVVHFSEAPPDESEAASVEILTTEKAPPYTPSAEPAVKPPAAAETEEAEHSAQPATETTDITTMSLADLNRLCEEQREERIAPLRKAEITKCIQEERKDPAYCERFFADYGNAGRTVNGTFRPRMFNDLPACLEAEKRQDARW